MKKSLILVPILIIALTVLAGCGKKEDASATVANTTVPATTAPATTATDITIPTPSVPIDIQVDKDLLDVTVTLPAGFTGSEEIKKQTIAEAKAEGIAVKENADGSVSYTMSKAKYEETMKTLEDSLTEGFDQLINDSEIKVFKSITANNDYTEIKVVVNKATYEEIKPFFNIYLLGINIGTGIYHVFNGKAGAVTTTTVFDEAGNKLDTLSYPE